MSEGGIVPLTVVHVMTECPEYPMQRRHYLGGNDIAALVGLSHLLRDDDTAVQQVLQYRRLTDLYNDI